MARPAGWPVVLFLQLCVQLCLVPDLAAGGCLQQTEEHRVLLVTDMLLASSTGLQSKRGFGWLLRGVLHSPTRAYTSTLYRYYVWLSNINHPIPLHAPAPATQKEKNMKPTRSLLAPTVVLFLLASSSQHHDFGCCNAFMLKAPSNIWQRSAVRICESTISSEATQSRDSWVAQSFETIRSATILPEEEAVVGPGRCLIYDTTLRGE
jgi:hypothetical protein